MFILVKKCFWRYRHKCQTICFKMTYCRNQWDSNQLNYAVFFCFGREKTYCISCRIDSFWMFHVTMVRWGFSHIMAFKNSLSSGWNDFDVSPDHGNPTWPSIHFFAELTLFECSTWPWSGEAFLTLWLLKTVSHQVETILMSHLTMETPPDHPYISRRVDYFWMFHLTMVKWGFFHIMAFKNSPWSCWNDFDVSPDHGNPTWPSVHL